MADSVIERFFSKVNKPADNGCWEWTAGKCPYNKYGRFSYKRQAIGAHRASWIIFNGDIPDGLYVLHKCDNRACVNPDHLFLGTHGDNMQDMKEKGRAVALRGPEHANSKLTKEQIATIRSLAKAGVSQRQIAKRFNVCQRTINKAINMVSYIHS